jgi:hypothetical protein
MIIDSDTSFENYVSILTQYHVSAVGRYYCDVASYKVIGPKEARQLTQANIRLFTVFEAEAVDLSKGKDHANAAMNCAKAIGQPQGSAIYFAIEKSGGFTPQDMPQVIQYFKDINATIAGKFDIGVYSNGTTCAALRGPPQLVKYTWLAMASYTHDGTWDFYTTGLWSIAQVGPLDIQTWLIPSWPVSEAVCKWKIDTDFVQGDFGSFIANPPTS